MLLAFADYLIANHYSPSQISVLSLYNGQLKLLKRQAMNYSRFNGKSKITFSTVDNYQGEENDIILLSLVRSNRNNSIGFLKIANRVCVALSRARQGLFIFGNASCLKNHGLMIKKTDPKDSIWMKVLHVLKENNAISKFLPLKCETHGNVSKVTNMKDFKKFSHGGCLEKCEIRLTCGHACDRLCHPIVKTEDNESGHAQINCTKKY